MVVTVSLTCPVVDNLTVIITVTLTLAGAGNLTVSAVACCLASGTIAFGKQKAVCWASLYHISPSSMADKSWCTTVPHMSYCPAHTRQKQSCCFQGGTDQPEPK